EAGAAIRAGNLCVTSLPPFPVFYAVPPDCCNAPRAAASTVAGSGHGKPSHWRRKPFSDSGTPRHRSPVPLELIMTISLLPDAVPDAMKPGIHCVRTNWILGFIAFHWSGTRGL